MRLQIIFLSLVAVVIGKLHAQEQEQETRPGFELVTFGPNSQNIAYSTAIEQHRQTRTALISMPVNDQFNLRTGITYTRIDIRDILEFPLLPDSQVTDRPYVFSEPMIRINNPLQATAEDISEDNRVMGSEYQLAPNKDASTQFVLPIIEGTNFEKSSLKASRPIRMHTGWKF